MIQQEHFEKFSLQKLKIRMSASPGRRPRRLRLRLSKRLILQENMRLKALAEIYTMHYFAQLCNHNLFVEICSKNTKFCKNQRIMI